VLPTTENHSDRHAIRVENPRQKWKDRADAKATSALVHLKARL